jgi:hypothetical protein
MEVTMGKSLTKRYLENQRRNENHAEAKKLVLAEWEKFCRKTDVSMLYALHNTFGFGKDRLERFYREWIKLHIAMVDNYQCDGDDSHYWVMEARLRDIGLDVDALLREVDEL